jgi:hypothetical protein
MATYNEPTRDYEFLVSEAPGTLSREVVSVVVSTTTATQVLAGMVLAVGPGSDASTADPVTYGPYDGVNATNSGYRTAVAVLAGTIDEAAGVTAGAVTATAIFRLAEVKNGSLQWGTTASTQTAHKATAVASLATKYIVARSS